MEARQRVGRVCTRRPSVQTLGGGQRVPAAASLGTDCPGAPPPFGSLVWGCRGRHCSHGREPTASGFAGSGLAGLPEPSRRDAFTCLSGSAPYQLWGNCCFRVCDGLELDPALLPRKCCIRWSRWGGLSHGHSAGSSQWCPELQLPWSPAASGTFSSTRLEACALVMGWPCVERRQGVHPPQCPLLPLLPSPQLPATHSWWQALLSPQEGGQEGVRGL